MKKVTFNIIIVKRTLEVLQQGRLKRTNFAHMAKLNYGQGMKYVNLLLLLGWVHIVRDDGYYISITESGMEMAQRLADLP